MKKKLIFITTSRADFYFINSLINKAPKFLNRKFKIYLLVSGSHFFRRYGSTYKVIKKVKGIKYLMVKTKEYNKDRNSTIKSISESLIKYGEILRKEKPDLVITFGDRHEMFAFSLAAYIFNIPQAHLSGGETTVGSIDEGFRHSITKFSNYHFPIASKYKERIINMGEARNRVFNHGSLVSDRIKDIEFLSKIELEKNFKIKFLKYNFLVVFHPETTELKKTEKNFNTLINTLKIFKKDNFIFTAPGFESESDKFIRIIKKECKKRDNFYFFENLGEKNFFSIMKYCTAIIGNSSSGISEAPYIGTPTLNIGNRQKGRINLKSIINSEITTKAITKSILFLKKFKIKKNKVLKTRVADRILNEIRKLNLKNFSKEFYDVK